MAVTDTGYLLMKSEDDRCEACLDRIRGKGRPVKLGTMGAWKLCDFHERHILKDLCTKCGHLHHYNCA